MELLNKKQKIIFIIILIILICFIGYYIIEKIENNNNYEVLEIDADGNIEVQEEKVEDEKIVIHITGEVQNEGIVKVKKDSRIIDVIEEAGGTTDEADLDKINLAYEVKDGQKIYIPNENEEVEEYIIDEAGENVIIEDKAINTKVNINTAMQTELETLSGIGPSTALKIIDYRNKNGKFKKIEDLKNVPGIGNAKYERIKEDICVD